jgi:hypothetical protein
MKPQPRWCYYRVFVKGRRRALAQFVGRHLGSEYPGGPGPHHCIYFCTLFECQDGYLYLVLARFDPPRAPERHPNYERIDCWFCLQARTREHLVAQFRSFAKAVGIDNPKIPALITPPVPVIEEMHTVTGYDA